MWDVRVTELAERQFNRISRSQLLELGHSQKAIAHMLGSGRLCIVEQGVFAISPVLEHDEWGRWMGATLTAPETFLSHQSAGIAWGHWGLRAELVTVTRRGNGGPRRHGGVLAYRSSVLEVSDCATLKGVPITSVPRTILDLGRKVSERGLARTVREAVRLDLTSIHELGDIVGRHRLRRGSRQLAQTLARYSGLPLERARSGAEIRAMEILDGAGFELPRLNFRIAEEEADLSWPAYRLIIEIDGGPFHLDRGEDARKQGIWESAGWRVLRIDAAHVYEDPGRLLRLVPNVPH